MATTFTQFALATKNTLDNQATHTGTAGTPASGDLLFAVIVVSDNTAVGSMSGTFTWIFLESYLHQQDTIYIFYANATSATSTTPVYTISGTSTGSAMYVVRISGAEGQTQPYIRQSATNNASTTNPSVGMTAAILTGNGCLGIAKNNTNSSVQWTAPSGWSEMTEQSYATPSISLEVASIASGETGSSIAWTNSNSTPWKLIVYEFYVAGTGPTECNPSCGILNI